MANIIRVVLEGSDQTGSAFASAARNARTFTTDLKVSSHVFRELGNVASEVGAGELSGLIGTFENATHSAVSLTKELGKSKLAIAALGVAVATAGFKVGTTLADALGFTGAGGEKAAAFNNQLSGIMRQIDAAQNRLTGGRGLSDELQRINEEITKLQEGQEAKGAFGGPSWLGGKAGMKAEEVEALVDKLRQLREVTLRIAESDAAMADADQFEEAKSKWEELIQVKYAAQDATLGLMNAETMRHQKALQEIGELVTTEQEKDSLIEAETQATEARKTQIRKDYADKQAQIAADLARKEQQIRQGALSAAGSLFGSLSALAAAQGRKGFALAQAFRYGETIVNTAAGVGRALADYPWPASAVIGALVAAAGAVQLATIASAKPSGQAHAGLTSVPEDATYRLVAGERVLAPTQNADLTEFLQGGGGQAVHNHVYLDGREILNYLGRASREGRLELDARSIV